MAHVEFEFWIVPLNWPSSDRCISRRFFSCLLRAAGQSGSYKIFLAGNTSNTFYNVNWKSLEEVDASGNHLPGNRAMQLSSMDVTTVSTAAGFGPTA